MSTFGNDEHLRGQPDAVELSALLARLRSLQPEKWTDEDVEEALNLGMQDPAGALPSYRLMVAQAEGRA
jgi:hypothetical protein